MDKQTDQDMAMHQHSLRRQLVIFSNVFFFFLSNRMHSTGLHTIIRNYVLPKLLLGSRKILITNYIVSFSHRIFVLRYFYDNDTRNDSVSFSSHTNASVRAYSPTLSFNRILVFDFRSVLVFFVTTIVEMLKKYFVGIST